MNKPVKTIQAMARDELGWEYPQALIAFFHIEKFSKEKWIADESDPNYRTFFELEEIAYVANFYANAQTHAKGLKSRPIYALDEDGNMLIEDGKPVTAFVVDVTEPKYLSIVNAVSDPYEAVMRVIETHYKTEVAV